MSTGPGSRQSGFSLIELMVALVAGLVVSAAVVAFTMSSFKSNGEFVQSAKLTQELRNSMDLVTRELRRAGYDQSALGKLATGTGTPFASMGFGNEITPATVPKKFRCVIYSYDRGLPGVNGTREPSNGEIRGLRLVRPTFNGQATGTIEYAVSTGTGAGKPSCDDVPPVSYTNYPPECTGTWCPLSDPAVLNITELALTDNRTIVGVSPNQVQVRDIDVQISGQLARSTEFTRTFTTSVRIRSDCFLPALSDCNASP